MIFQAYGTHCYLFDLHCLHVPKFSCIFCLHPFRPVPRQTQLQLQIRLRNEIALIPSRSRLNSFHLSVKAVVSLVLICSEAISFLEKPTSTFLCSRPCHFMCSTIYPSAVIFSFHEKTTKTTSTKINWQKTVKATKCTKTAVRSSPQKN